MTMRFALSILVLVISHNGLAKAIIDSPDSNLQKLFHETRTKYVIRYHHTFIDTLTIPEGCELAFDGGSLSGPIKFVETKLSGRVNLHGSTLSGSIRNKVFNADWICAADGITDDAECINDMIKVCGYVLFPKGKYRLKSAFSPNGIVDKKLHSSIQTHIGIHRSHVKLIGDEGAEFVTDEPLCTICVFSLPNQIDNSIRDVEICGLTFTVHNNGKDFHEFMHTIKLMGVNGMTIKNCKFNDFWGDAICLSHYGDDSQTGERSRNQEVKILNNHIEGGVMHNNRNGISIINGKNVLIKNNTIRNTSRKDMPGGIDVEPNNSAYTIDSIRILKNSIEDVWTNAIIVYIHKNAPAHNINIEDNVIRNCGHGVYVGIMSDNTTDNIEIINNYVDEKTVPYIFSGEGISANWVVKNNTFDRPCVQDIPGTIKVKNLVVKGNKKKE